MNASIERLYKQAQQNAITLNYIDATENYKKIIELAPTNVNKYIKELGEMYEKQNMFYKSVECYVTVLKTEKTDISLIGVLTNQIGACYFNISQFKLAIHYFKKVLLIKEISDVYFNIGVCNVSLKMYKEAETYLFKALAIDSQNMKAGTSLGELYYFIKKYNKSIEFYKKYSIPKTVQQLYNLSFSYLAKRDFKKGFELYENRLQFNNVNKQTNTKDRVEINLDDWDGTQKCDKLLIVAEQGLGDNIQFYRFIIELSKKCPHMQITYFCKREIAHLFKTFANVTIITSINLLNYDYKVFIMSLPKLLNLSTIVSNKINYINVDNDKLLFWKNKTDHLKRLKVGFVYSGLLSSFIEKNIPLQSFEILCDLNIDLICIHRKNEIEDDFNKITFADKITHFDIDNDAPFEDTVHLLKNIDLLITIDTFIVHLAGILNVKTWLLLGYSEWRWSNLNATYWYDSVELIRTKEDEEFKDILHTVKNKLKTFI